MGDSGESGASGDFNASPESAVTASMGDIGGGRRTKRRIMYHSQRQGQSQGQQGGKWGSSSGRSSIKNAFKFKRGGGKRYGVVTRRKHKTSRKSRKHRKKSHRRH
jgi:hypothetical protein